MNSVIAESWIFIFCRKNKEKGRGGRPPLDPRKGGLLGPGPGQLVQTPDGRLVALGPANTFYEVRFSMYNLIKPMSSDY